MKTCDGAQDLLEGDALERTNTKCQCKKTSEQIPVKLYTDEGVL